MLKDIVLLIASLWIFGAVYWVINMVVGIFQSIFPISDDIVLAVYFLWSIVPAIFYIGQARKFLEARSVGGIEVEYPDVQESRRRRNSP